MTRFILQIEIAIASWLVGGALALAQNSPPPVQPQPGKLVNVEVTIADLPADGSGGTNVGAERVLELEKQGKLEAITRVHLSTLENVKAYVQIGERVPTVTSRMLSSGRRSAVARPGGLAPGGGAEEAAEPGDARRTAGGMFVNNYAIQNVGTMVTVTPRVESDGSILMEIDIEKSRVAPAGADAPAPDSTGLVPDRIVSISARSALRVANGKTVIFSGQQATAKSNSRTCILVTASADAAPAVQAEAPIKVFQLKYAQAKDAAGLLGTLFKHEGFAVGVDERTNSLTVRGLPDRLAEIEAVLSRIDQSDK